MGTLKAMHYSISATAGLADHTYVECGTGARGWACWAGKSGGCRLRRSTASTSRANAIARPNEQANIACYAFNGVCHQSANRILIAAMITVSGARGYDVSEAMFGTYGRTSVLGRCRSPFNQHAATVGDLPECAAPPPAIANAFPMWDHDATEREQRYLRRVVRLYESAPGDDPAQDELQDFMLRLFDEKVDFALGSAVDKRPRQRLLRQRTEIEVARPKLEEAFHSQHLAARTFIEEFNQLTIDFQNDCGDILTETQYESLLGLRRGDVVILADPDIAETS